MITPGVPLTFSKEDKESLGREVCSILGDLERQYDKKLERVRKAWSWYEAEKLSERKTHPWPGASNVVIPIVQIHADATHARYILLLKSHENVWVGKTRNEDFSRLGLDREIPRFLNWSASNEFDFDTPTNDWMLEIIVADDGVLTLGWEERTAMVILPREKKAQEVLIKSGPALEHIPRENCLWDTNYRAWDAPVFAKRSLLTWSDLVGAADKAEWDWEAIQEIKNQTTEGSSDSAGDVTRDRELRSGSDRDSAPTAYRLYDIREVWIDWPLANRMIGDKPPQEMEDGDQLSTIVVFVHRNSGKVLKVQAKPWLIPDKPFYDAYFKKRPGINASGGLAHRLSDIQEACSTFVNQSADAVTKANAFNLLTSDAQLAAKTNIGPAEVNLATDVNEVTELGLSKGIGPDMALFAQLNIIAERMTGINDPALGRETRMGGHPAPATSTLSLLSEGKKLDITAIRSIRGAISKMGLDLAMLYQQMELDQEKIIKAVGWKDAEKVLGWMFSDQQSIPGNLELDLATVSETMNPETERQKSLSIFQVTANYYALVTQYLQLAANPQAPKPLVAAMLKGLMALQKSYEKFLEAGDIDDIEAYTIELEQLVGSIVRSRTEAERSLANSPVGAVSQGAGGPPGGNGAGLGSGL